MLSGIVAVQGYEISQKAGVFFLKYSPQNQFKWHTDQGVLDEATGKYFNKTGLIYLNEGKGVGGTSFSHEGSRSARVHIQPKKGHMVVFDCGVSHCGNKTVTEKLALTFKLRLLSPGN